MAITRLNHAVLFVRDADVAAEFYAGAFGFEELSRPSGMRAVFMRSPAGANHHDLGLFEVGREAPRPARGSTGLYHLAWEIDTIEGLAEMATSLRARIRLGLKSPFAMPRKRCSRCTVARSSIPAPRPATGLISR